jgi:hypothetical protein
MTTEAHAPKQGAKRKQSKRQESSTKKYVILFAMGLMLYGYSTSIYKFRLGAEKENVPTRSLSDLWFIALASLINLVSLKFWSDS